MVLLSGRWASQSQSAWEEATSKDESSSQTRVTRLVSERSRYLIEDRTLTHTHTVSHTSYPNNTSLPSGLKQTKHQTAAGSSWGQPSRPHGKWGPGHGASTLSGFAAPCVPLSDLKVQTPTADLAYYLETLAGRLDQKTCSSMEHARIVQEVWCMVESPAEATRRTALLIGIK